MEHSERCCSFESCADCYEKLYSMEAVVAQLEREAHLKKLKAKSARLLRYELSEAKKRSFKAERRLRFQARYGIEVHTVQPTVGERDLRDIKRFRKWRVPRGGESGLRKVWTVVGEEDGGVGEDDIQDLVDEGNRVKEGSVRSDNSGDSSPTSGGSPKD